MHKYALLIIAFGILLPAYTTGSYNAQFEHPLASRYCSNNFKNDFYNPFSGWRQLTATTGMIACSGMALKNIYQGNVRSAIKWGAGAATSFLFLSPFESRKLGRIIRYPWRFFDQEAINVVNMQCEENVINSSNRIYLPASIFASIGSSFLTPALFALTHILMQDRAKWYHLAYPICIPQTLFYMFQLEHDMLAEKDGRMPTSFYRNLSYIFKGIGIALVAQDVIKKRQFTHNQLFPLLSVLFWDKVALFPALMCTLDSYTEKQKKMFGDNARTKLPKKITDISNPNTTINLSIRDLKQLINDAKQQHYEYTPRILWPFIRNQIKSPKTHTVSWTFYKNLFENIAKNNSLSNFPDELILHILSFCTLHNGLTIAQTIEEKNSSSGYNIVPNDEKSTPERRITIKPKKLAEFIKVLA